MSWGRVIKLWKVPFDKELKTKMLMPTNPSVSLRRGLTLAIAAIAFSGGAAMLSAQTTVSAPAVDFGAYAKTSFAPNADLTSSSSSSSSSEDAFPEASLTSVDPLHLNAMQYQRRRYGRPRYRGNNTNPDGSNKWMGYGGGGFTQPVGNTWHYDTPSWGVQVGAGRQFSYKFAVPVEFSWDNFGLTKQTLDNQLALYNNQIDYYCTVDPTDCAANSVTPFTTLDGNAHVWSFSVQPTYTLFGDHDGMGTYVLAGAGFYHKVTNFTIPTVGEYCDYYYGCYEYSANEVIDHYTSNAPGFDAGIGFTYKVSHFSNLKLYAEARYVIILNSQRQGITVNTPGADSSTATNEYPANSNRTSYFPIKFGIRF